MSRVEGKYVATVTIEWDREREPNMLPLQDIKDNAKFLTANLTDVILDAIDECSEVEIVEHHCEFYEVEDDYSN